MKATTRPLEAFTDAPLDLNDVAADDGFLFVRGGGTALEVEFVVDLLRGFLGRVAAGKLKLAEAGLDVLRGRLEASRLVFFLGGTEFVDALSLLGIYGHNQNRH